MADTLVEMRQAAISLRSEFRDMVDSGGDCLFVRTSWSEIFHDPRTSKWQYLSGTKIAPLQCSRTNKRRVNKAKGFGEKERV